MAKQETKGGWCCVNVLLVVLGLMVLLFVFSWLAWVLNWRG